MEHIPKNQFFLLVAWFTFFHFFPLILAISFSSFPQKAGDDPDKLLGDGSTTNSDLEKYTDPIKCKDLGYAQLGSKPLRPLDGCAMFLLPFPGPAACLWLSTLTWIRMTRWHWRFCWENPPLKWKPSQPLQMAGRAASKKQGWVRDSIYVPMDFFPGVPQSKLDYVPVYNYTKLYMYNYMYIFYTCSIV